MSRWRELWKSGELDRVGQRCTTIAEFSAALGCTRDALDRGLSHLRAEGHPVPTASAFLARKKPEPQSTDAPLVVDQWDEPTQEYAMPPMAPQLDPVDEHRLQRKVRELEAANRQLVEQLMNTQDALGVLREAAQHRVAPLAMREHSSGKREAASLICVSDCHVEEVVNAASVNGLNEHNPDIARARMARLFEGARWLTNHSRQSHQVRDVVLWIGGDIISGTIHEDLSETNSMGTPQAVAFAQQLLGDGIRHLLADPELETLRVVCSVGNHGRLTDDVRVNTRIETNIETLLYLILAREFASDPRVSFDLPKGELTYSQIYGRTVRWMHGDAIKYGGALGGITNPINKAVASWDQSIRADLTVMGHWHQYFDGGRWLVNGSTVGHGAFSVRIKAAHERPQQAWALLDSKRWRSLSAPIWVDE